MKFARTLAVRTNTDDSDGYRLVAMASVNDALQQLDAQYFGYQIADGQRIPFIGFVREGKLFTDDGDDDPEISWWSNLPSRTLSEGAQIADFFKNSSNGEEGDLLLTVEFIKI